MATTKNWGFLADMSTDGARVYARLAERLDALYMSVDTALVDAGHRAACDEFHLGAVKTDAATGRTFVDLATAFVLPFDVGAASGAVWTLFSKSADDVPAVDSPRNTMRSTFTVSMPFRFGDVLFDGHLVGKRIVEDTRVVLVWSTQGTCGSKAFDFDRMPMQESGWSVLERVASRTSDTSAATIVRTVVRIYPQVGNARSESRAARTLAKAVATSFQESAERMLRAADNMFMNAAVR